MYARRFLWTITVIIFLVIAGAFAYRLLGWRLLSVAMVPSVSFEASPKAAGPDYATAAAWYARPGMANDPSRWTPAGFTAAPHSRVAVFYVTPTAYLGRDRWTMPFEDAATNARIGQYIRSQASIFNGVASVWSPKYRQASFGAFLTDKPDAAKALDLAYADVLRAFDAFVAAVPADAPIILAGHSQGSLHLLRLLKERVAGQPIAARIVAVYAPGWPMSLTADLPATGLPACNKAEATGCLLSWQSFAQPADYAGVRDGFDAQKSLTGLPRKDTAILCTNPLLGHPSRQPVFATSNIGSLVPDKGGTTATVEPRRVAAGCTADGILSIGAPPDGFGEFVLPGNNYHVYDYMLFWANLRADVEARVSAYTPS